MSKDIKGLQLQPRDRVWHPMCITDNAADFGGIGPMAFQVCAASAPPASGQRLLSSLFRGRN